MMKIYIDILIITNTIVTLICIEATARITHTAAKNRCLFTASLIGGLTSLLIIPNAYDMTVAVILTVIKFTSFPVITLTAFRWRSFKYFIRRLVVFVLAKIVFAGMTIVFWQISDSRIIFIRNYTIYFNIPILYLTAAVIGTYLLLTVFDIVRKAGERSKKYTATYKCGNYCLSAPAVADTGNKLTDPFSNTPVVIFYCDDLYYHYSLDSPESLYTGRFRLLPFETISGSGLIAVTYSGSVEISEGSRLFKDLRCCVGITRSNGHGSRAIFDPSIIL